MASSSVFIGHSSVLILDYGSQYTQLIARRIRDYGVLSILLPGDVTMVRVAKFDARLVMHSSTTFSRRALSRFDTGSDQGGESPGDSAVWWAQLGARGGCAASPG